MKKLTMPMLVAGVAILGLGFLFGKWSETPITKKI